MPLPLWGKSKFHLKYVAVEIGQYLTASTLRSTSWRTQGQSLHLLSISFPSNPREKKCRSSLWLTAWSRENFKLFTMKRCLWLAEDPRLVCSKPPVAGWWRRQVCQELRSHLFDFSMWPFPCCTVDIIHYQYFFLMVFPLLTALTTNELNGKSHSHFPLPTLQELCCQGHQLVGCWGQKFVFLQLLRQAERADTA